MVGCEILHLAIIGTTERKRDKERERERWRDKYTETPHPRCPYGAMRKTLNADMGRSVQCVHTPHDSFS